MILKNIIHFFVISICFCTFVYSSDVLNNLAQKAKKDPKLAMKLASMYENGDGVDKDIIQAMFWYKHASELFSNKNLEHLVSQNKNTYNVNLSPSEENKIKKNKYYFDNFIHEKDNIIEVENDYSLVLSHLGLRPYHPTFFLPITYSPAKGDDRKNTEAFFQISLKKDIFYNTFGLNDRIGFAYTQKSWWQIYEESSPFRETNYLPEIYINVPIDNEVSYFKSYQVGLLHESNGLDGPESRSWNRLYLTGYFEFEDFFLYPRIWWRVPESSSNDDNPDIEDYIGYADVNVIFPYGKQLFHFMFRNNFHINGENKGAASLEWSYPIGNTGMFTYIYGFTGYGDSLIDYDRYTNRIGIGLSFSR